MQDWFRKCAQKTSAIAGTYWAFLAAISVIVIWLITGPIFGFSDTWQLVINTGTTIVTFLMVFLIQNTQNRDAMAMHLKLDEVIRALESARNMMLEIEELSDDELRSLEKEFMRLRNANSAAADDQVKQQLQEVKQTLDKAERDVTQAQQALKAKRR